MNWKLENSFIKLGFFTGLLILFILSSVAFLSFKKNDQKEIQEHISFHILSTNKEILVLVKDIESTNRGYMISGKIQFLESYYESKKQLLVELTKFQNIDAKNYKRQQNVQHLKAAIYDKIDFIDKKIQLRKTKGHDLSASELNISKGKKLMDAIQIISIRIEQQELLALHKSQIVVAQLEHTIKSILLIGTVMTILIFLIVYLSLIKQIEKRRKNEELLFIQNEWYTQTLLCIGDGVITTNTLGEITMLNHAASEITGWNNDEVKGKHMDLIFDIIDEKTGEKAINPAVIALQENRTVFLAKNTLLKTKEGKFISIEDSGATIQNRNGNIIGSVLIFRDTTERKKAERERDLIYATSIDMIGIAKGDRFISVNPAFGKILGYTENELLTKSFLDLIHKEDIEPTRLELEKTYSGQSVINFVNRYKNKDGQYIWIEWNAIPLGEIIFANGRDITERIKAEEATKSVYTKFFQILESNVVAIAILKIKTNRIIYANDALSHMLGFETKQILGKKSYQIKAISDDECERITQLIVSNQGSCKEIESTFIRTNGELIHVHFSVESLEIDGSMCYLASFIDISQRKITEEEIKVLNQNLEKRVAERTLELQDQQKFTDEILHKIPTEIAVYDENEYYLYVNPKGVDSEETRNWIIGKNDFDLVKHTNLDEDIAQKRKESFEKVKQDKHAEWIDKITNEDGSIKYMLRILHPLSNKKYILTGYDITDLKIAEKEKQQYINDLEEMMFITSHKVRHPVTQIMGLSNLLDEFLINKNLLSEVELIKIVGYLKQSIGSLDSFTKELTAFMYDAKSKNDKLNQ
jgi:PAS domain S-box-containing protein